MPSIGLCRFDPHIMHQLFAYQWKRDPPAFFVFISFIVRFVRVLRFSSLPSNPEHRLDLALRVRSRRHSMTDSRPIVRIGSIANLRLSWLNLLGHLVENVPSVEHCDKFGNCLSLRDIFDNLKPFWIVNIPRC